MLSLHYQVLIALALDILLGDPERFPHPVRLIGRAATAIEAPLRRLIPAERFAGIVAALLICGGSAALVYGATELSAEFHPVLRDILSIYVMYSCIALRDMMRHSSAVYEALKQGDIEKARKQLARIVGRDTDQLDGPGIVRAAVESVAESTVDGVMAPLFFCFLAGPAGAIFHKATSTLDSTFGYTTERYIRFGWASARLDDLLNWIPARLSGVFIAGAALLTREHPVASLRIFFRDGRNHASPNAGWPEAAFAGALGVQLGGANFYAGEKIDKPTIGDALHALTPDFIPRANRLLFIATLINTGINTGTVYYFP